MWWCTYWLISYFGYCEQCWYKHSGVSLALIQCVHIFWVQVVGLLGHMASLSLVFTKSPYPFQRWLHWLTFILTVYKCSPFRPAFVTLCVLNNSHCDRVRWLSHWGTSHGIMKVICRTNSQSLSSWMGKCLNHFSSDLKQLKNVHFHSSYSI